MCVCVYQPQARQFLNLSLPASTLSWTWGRGASSLRSHRISPCPVLSPQIRLGVAPLRLWLCLLPMAHAIPLGRSLTQGREWRCHIYPQVLSQLLQAGGSPLFRG